jgi:tetraacyldisaccharide 4'-kinase
VQWPQVQAAVIVGDGERGEALAAEAGQLGKPALAARLSPDRDAAARLSGRRVLAFAGIGRPKKFFSTLEALGAEVVLRRPFPDHHFFRADQLEALWAEADRAGLTLVTTEKDRVRLTRIPALPPLEVLPVRLVFDEVLLAKQLLAEALARFRANPSRPNG